MLEAIALFLERDLKGQLTDPRLGFRVLIAAHLAQTLAAELRHEAEHDAAELQSLAELLDVADQPHDDPKVALHALRRELAERLKKGELTPAAAMMHLRDTLARRLQIVSPRFDLREEID
jgi:Domain of unknown function (DUF6285)